MARRASEVEETLHGWGASPLPPPPHPNPPHPNPTLTDRVIIIGGTAGIGAALAAAAAASGADVTVVGRTQRDASLRFVRADLQLMSTAQRVARELPAESVDVLVFTAGIVPGNVRQETAERVELDMACSALNRHVMLKEMVPRLKASARVLIWGFPGSGGGDYLKEASVQDFNSTAKFHGGFGQAHMNTVALNEALVLHWAAKGAMIAGFNPGLVVTDIRKPLHGGGADSCVESCIIPCCAGGLKTGPYVQKVLYTLTTPDLEANKGVMIHQDGTPIKQSPQMTPEVVAQWIAAADGLAASALATSGASK